MTELFVFVIITIICTANGNPMENFTSHSAKFVKTMNEDVHLKCLLLDKHESFNQNSNVSWWFKNPFWDERAEWDPVNCGNQCAINLRIDADSLGGFYQCRMFPYYLDNQTALQIEFIKTFEILISDSVKLQPPPEILKDIPNEFSLKTNSQIVINCKCKSSQKPVIKWFRKKDDFKRNDDYESYKNFMESSRSIRYFENFYTPVESSGLKKLNDNLYLSKLFLSNMTESSVFVCVAINYFGFSYRETLVNVESDQSEIVGDTLILYPEKKNYEILILATIFLLAPSSVLLLTLMYLLFNRQIMRINKALEVV